MDPQYSIHPQQHAQHPQLHPQLHPHPHPHPQLQRNMWEIFLNQKATKKSGELCPICRSSINDKCIECFANNTTSDEYREQIQTTWKIVLMCNKRMESPLSLLSIEILALIYSYIIGPIEVYSDCPIVILECHHTYHSHCWSRWTKKRPNCPLDNLMVPILSEDYFLTKSKHAKLISCGKFETSYEERLRVRHLHERLDAQICRLLKPRTRRGGYTLEQINGFVESRGISHVHEVLNDLVKREYIIYNDETKRYEYNP